MNNKNKKPEVDDSKAILGGKVEILLEDRLKHFDAGPVMAYRAKFVDDSISTPVVALVCRRDLMPREDISYKYEEIAGLSMLPLVARGEVKWPNEKQKKYVFVYKQIADKPFLENQQTSWPAAGAVFEPIASTALGLNPDKVIKNVIIPMSRILLDFRNKDFIHGRINTYNIYSSSDKSNHSIILGECLSCPASFAQPVIYESIQRAMTDPIGRGLGTQADDLYSFGVTLAVMLRKHDPMGGINTHEMIKRKMEIGSFSALTDGERFPAPLLELLRGLLNDDTEDRWDVDSLLAWIDGMRLSPKQSKILKPASRPITFAGKKYLRPDFLAMDLQKNSDKLDAIIDNGELETWIGRALEDDAMLQRFEKNVHEARQKGRGAGYTSRLACYLSIVLDPKAPIRYGDMALNPEGIGTALASSIIKNKNINNFGQILSCGIVSNWVNSQEGLINKFADLLGRFEECSKYIKNTKYGYGLERCVYVLNTSCFCLSPVFENAYVHTSQDMLNTLESLCESGEPPSSFLDRHSIAFLHVKDRASVETFMFELNSTDSAVAFMGAISCLASIQRKNDIKPLSSLSNEIASRLGSVYDKYHDRILRSKLEENISDFAKQGNLSKIASLLNNDKLMQQDKLGLRRSQHDYALISREYQLLNEQMKYPAIFGKKSGQQVGSLISSAIGGLIILVVAFVYMAGKHIL